MKKVLGMIALIIVATISLPSFAQIKIIKGDLKALKR